MISETPASVSKEARGTSSPNRPCHVGGSGGHGFKRGRQEGLKEGFWEGFELISTIRREAADEILRALMEKPDVRKD